MKFTTYFVPVVMACMASEHDTVARPCRVVVQRDVAQPVFAVPVATVVFAVQPTVLYSYRATAQPAPLAKPATPVMESKLEAPSAARVLREHCFACHHGEAPRSGASFFHDDGTLEDLLPRRAIVEMASPSGDTPAQMPPGEASKLTEEELALLREWAVPPRDLKY